MPRTKKTELEVKEIEKRMLDEVTDIASNIKGEDKKNKKESEKTDAEETRKKKLEKLKEKAKELEKTIAEEIDIKKKVISEEKETLVPIEDYLKSSLHLGTRAITPDMKPYVYKRRADSLAVFNTALLDEKIREGADYLAKYAPNEVVVVCKREAGEKAIEIFSNITGIRVFIKKYPAGILTNPNLENFLETELLVVCDPWIDKAALEDALRIKIPVMAICDTNNYTMNINKVIPGNNKSAKSLGMIFYLLAKIYVEKRKLNVTVPQISEWIDGWETLVPPK